MAFEPSDLRAVMARWPTGVSVVTGRGPSGEPIGIVIGSFSSVSLSPPLISFYPQKTLYSWQAMKSTGRFYINILTEDQVELCKRFSGGPQPDRFSDLKYDVTESGLPMLLDCAAWLEAEIENEYEAGDHWIVIGRVTSIRNGRDAMPLVFAHGKLHGISALHS